MEIKGVVDDKDDTKRVVGSSLEGSSSSFLATRTPPAPACPTQAHFANARSPTAAAQTARRAPKRLAPVDAFIRTSFGAAGRSYVALLQQSFSVHHVQEYPPPPTPSPSLVDLLLLLSYSLNTHARLRLSNPNLSNHNTQAPPVSRAHPPLRVDLLRSLGRLPLARRGCVLLPWFPAWVPFNGVQGCVLGDRWVGLLWISVCWCTVPPSPFLFTIVLEKRLTCAKCSLSDDGQFWMIVHLGRQLAVLWQLDLQKYERPLAGVLRRWRFVSPSPELVGSPLEEGTRGWGRGREREGVV